MKNIFVFGSINLDLTVYTSRLPEKGETMRGQDFIMNFGGKGANQAVAAARLGGKVKMCGRVGNDSFGDMMASNLSHQGVDVSAVAKDPYVKSGVAVITVVDGDNQIILQAGANAAVTEKDVDAFLSQSRPGDIFLTQLENPLAVTKHALGLAKAKGMLVVLNPAPVDTGIKDVLANVDILIPNENELKQLSGSDDLEKGCVSLISKGTKMVITTLGNKGYCYHDAQGSIYGSCLKVKAVDTTGAGDTFCGALVAQIAQNVVIKEALHFAAVAASLSVTKKGAQDGIPTVEEVRRFVA